MEKLNDNQKNIKLTYEISNTSIHFLDLNIQLTKNGFPTKTFFKPVERNSYIPVDSCHFDPWLINILKGQLIRLRRNCTDKSTFLEQANIIGRRFVQKGYNNDFIEDKIKEVSELSREELIRDKQKKTTQYQEINMILDYNIHRQIEHIFKKHWSLLLADHQLCSILPEKPKFVYRKAPTLRDIIVKNVLDPLKISQGFTFFSKKGFLSM